MWHCHNVTLLHCHSVNCPNVTLSPVTMSIWDIVNVDSLTLSHCHTVTLLHCHTVTILAQFIRHDTLGFEYLDQSKNFAPQVKIYIKITCQYYIEICQVLNNFVKYWRIQKNWILRIYCKTLNKFLNMILLYEAWGYPLMFQVGKDYEKIKKETNLTLIERSR